MMFAARKLSIAIRGLLFASCAVPLATTHAGRLYDGTLEGADIPKYVAPLVVPPVMPKRGVKKTWHRDAEGRWQREDADYYEIAVRQFQQQILPAQGWTDSSGAVVAPNSMTTVWSYGSPKHPGTVAEGGSFFYPAFTVEARSHQPDRVKWINDLVDDQGNFIPHLLPVDQTLHWANPMQDCRPHTGYDVPPQVGPGEMRTDCAGQTAAPYAGPVPMVAHLHGAHVGPESDGYPEAWWLPAANDIPAGFETKGSLFDDITGSDKTKGRGTNNGDRGYALYEYPNSQPGATLWYHDHTLGMTRANVYAGPAGFWLLRDRTEKKLKLPGPAPKSSKFNPKKRYYEIPLAIQDRSFNPDGSLYYPESRARFDGYNGVTMPQSTDGVTMDSDIAPIWNPEAFFETMVVNGQTWPYLDVEPRQYRLRLLNGSNSRFLNLSLQAYDANGDNLGEVPMYQIGGDGGLLPKVVEVITGYKTPLPGNGRIPKVKDPAPHIDEAMLMGPAERMDVIVDFASVPHKTSYVRMENTGPDAPFGGFPIAAEDMPDVYSTGQVMEFRMATKGKGKGKVKDPSTPVAKLKLPGIKKLKANRPVRHLSLNEEESNLIFEAADPVTGEVVPVGPTAALLGLYDPAANNGAGAATPLLWADGIQINPSVGSTEEWEIYNLTEDAHPIHLHLVQFQILERRGIDGSPIDRDGLGGPDCAAPCIEPNEAGWKDTVLAYPGEVTKVIANFDMAGLYVWHCHILEHEDNEMMLPFCVGEEGKDCPSFLF